MSCVGLCANDFNCGNARDISFMDLPRAGAEVADEGARLAPENGAKDFVSIFL